MDLLIRYGHVLGLMVLFASVVAAHVQLAPTISGAQARRLAVLDRIAGLSVLLVLATGVLLVLGHGSGKSPEYFLRNGVFHLKATLVVVLLALAVRPALFFMRHRAAEATAEIAVPRAIILMQRLQLVILLVLPLLGILITRGVGLRG